MIYAIRNNFFISLHMRPILSILGLKSIASFPGSPIIEGSIKDWYNYSFFDPHIATKMINQSITFTKHENDLHNLCQL